MKLNVSFGVFIVLALFITFGILNTFHTSWVELSSYSVDESSCFSKLLLMYQGLIEHNPVKLMSYGFYQYGFVYFFLTMLLCVPAFFLKCYGLAIWIPRMVSVCFMLVAAVYAYRFLSLFVEKNIARMSVFLCLLMPIGWGMALIFKPDWAMTAALIASVYYFSIDQGRWSQDYWKGVVAFSLGVAVKVQAVTFLPLLLMVPWVSGSSFVLVERIKKTGMNLGILALVFVTANPFLLHPIGRFGFIHRFKEEMLNNSVPVGLVFKLHHLSSAYLSSWLWIPIVLGCVLLLTEEVRLKTFSFISVMIITLVINGVYFLWIIPRSQPHHYLTLMVLLILVFSISLKKVSPRYAVGILSVFLIFQLVFERNSYAAVLHRQLGFALEQKEAIRLSEQITNQLKPMINSRDYLLVSPTLMVDFVSLGVPYDHVEVKFGRLFLYHLDEDVFYKKWQKADLKKNPIKTFHEKRFLVFLKSDLEAPLPSTLSLEQKKEAELVRANLNTGTLGYRKFYETKELVFFSKQ